MLSYGKNASLGRKIQSRKCTEVLIGFRFNIYIYFILI